MNATIYDLLFKSGKNMKPYLRKVLAVNFLLTTLAYASTDCSAQPTLLALSKNDHTLAIINSATLKVIARVPVGPDPHEVVASTDGKFAYITNTGGGRSYEINVID